MSMHNLDLRIGERYRLVRRIGRGGFGAVYLATNLNNGEEVALKLEHRKIEDSLIEEEYEIYQSLASRTGIPKVHWCGSECDYEVMAFELLGPSLEDLFNYCGRVFSLKTVLMLADQIISRVQCIHSKDIIHRDIKSDNFLMGRGRNGNCVYIIDFGLAQQFLRGRTAPVVDGSHYGLLGTEPFASVNGHRGIEQSPRDDMESLGYMIVYFLKGRLPWFTGKRKPTQRRRSKQHTKTRELKQQAYRLTMDRKAGISLDELCSDTPEEIRKYVEHVRSLNYGDQPDYSRLRRMFRDLFVRRGFKYDSVFDWTVLKYKEPLRAQLQKIQPP